jgi:ABC-2 type transport system permease protein
MTAQDHMAEAPLEAPADPAPVLSPTRPFYWSVRRELWEHRSLQIAPLAMAALIFVGFLLSCIGMPDRRRVVLTLDPVRQAAEVAPAYDMAAVVIILTSLLVGMTYCLAALQNERRDRSILFWKSLPVSDLTTVLSKVFVPFVVLPVIATAVILATQVAMLIWSGLILLLHGINPVTPLPLPQMTVVLLYGLVTMTLWYAPVYGWLLLVSGWARRGAFLWALLPPLALCLLEKLAFNSTHLLMLLGDRLSGGYSHAFVSHAHVAGTHMAGKGPPRVPLVGLSQLDPGKFLAAPGLWIGLVLAAACIAGAVWLRRRREPI